MNFGNSTKTKSSSENSTDIYHAIFKHFLDGIVGINERGIIQALNPAAEIIFGYNANELIGKNVSLLMPEPYRSAHDSYLKRYCDEGDARIVGFSREVTGLRKDGALFPMELAVTEATDHNKRIFLGSVRDLSTEKYYQTSLKTAEAQLRLSQEYAGVAHWHYDIETKQMECSDNFKAIHGFPENSENSFNCEKIFSYVHPDDRNSVTDSFTQCLVGTNPCEIDVEYRIVNINGNLQWVHLKGGVEKNDQGLPIFIHGVIQNITHRKNAESREVALGQIIDKAQIEIYIIDVNTFKFIEVNELARDNLGYTLDDLLTLTPLDVKKGLQVEDFYLIINPLYGNEQESVCFQSEHFRKNGSTYPVEVKLQFMTYAGQEVYVAFCEDITERLNIMNKLHDASKAKSEFLSRMSHELRTPMNAILGFSQLLGLNDKEPLTEDQSENVNEICKAGNHLLELINEILDLSKIEAGKVSLSFEPVELVELAKNVQQLVEPIANQNGIAFINEVNSSLCLVADATRCTQILINLVSNAIKYNQKKGSVILRTSILKENLRIEVEDTGIGLTEQQIETIFLPFERLGAETSGIEGTGIGLTLTKELVELMGGEIGVRSQLGKGSCFWFTLPMLQNEKCHSCWKIKKKQHRSDNTKTTKTELQAKDRKVILYIEDNLANIRLVDKLIQKQWGYKLLSAQNIDIGLEIAREHTPCLILMDIHLPGINGIEGKKLFSLDAELADIPMVALSASAMPTQIKQVMAIGFKKFLPLPINTQDLRNTIDLLIK